MGCARPQAAPDRIRTLLALARSKPAVETLQKPCRAGKISTCAPAMAPDKLRACLVSPKTNSPSPAQR